MLLIIILVIIVLYVLLIGSFVWGFDRVADFKLTDHQAKTGFSIIIPFRNEAEHLLSLLRSLSQLDYPKHLFEILLVDDDSTDDSVQVIHKSMAQFKLMGITVLKNNRLTQSPKKDAITEAISKAKHDWIVTTDADCQVPKFWLDCLDSFIQQHNANCIVSPVSYSQNKSFLNQFQILDLLSLQAATIGGFGINKPFLCNGANLAYKKLVFENLNGFEGNAQIASGDDVFLLEKMLKKDSSKVHYLKTANAIVTSIPQKNFKDLVAQRVRWAAKTSSYKNKFGKITGVIVLLMNALLLLLPLLFVLGVISLKLVIYVLIIKFAIDFLLLFKSARFFEQESILTTFTWSCFLYPFFSVYVAIVSVFKGYSWKGRAYRK